MTEMQTLGFIDNSIGLQTETSRSRLSILDQLLQLPLCRILPKEPHMFGELVGSTEQQIPDSSSSVLNPARNHFTHTFYPAPMFEEWLQECSL
jgi:hypothetical protein